jgi:hypothetical protein
MNLELNLVAAVWKLIAIVQRGVLPLTPCQAIACQGLKEDCHSGPCQRAICNTGFDAYQDKNATGLVTATEARFERHRSQRSNTISDELLPYMELTAYGIHSLLQESPVHEHGHVANDRSQSLSTDDPGSSACLKLASPSPPGVVSERGNEGRQQ